MRRIEAIQALARLEARRSVGMQVDDRLMAEVKNPGDIYLLRFSDCASYLSLVWQSVPDTRLLTPVGQPRTLVDCVTRLESFDWSFPRMCDLGHRWFEKCVRIDEEFDYAKFDLLAIVPLNDHERRESPCGSFYIYDGVHKSLVLAKQLFRKEVRFMPVEALYFLPRRG